MPHYKYQQITEKIIGAAVKVHSTLGNGFPEVIYQRALALQMEADGLNFKRECNMVVYYLGRNIVDRRVDFFEEEKICVEPKAFSNLEPVHFSQARNCLEAFNREVGLLLNFGAVSLQYKRLTNNKYNPINPNHLKI